MPCMKGNMAEKLFSKIKKGGLNLKSRYQNSQGLEI